MFKLSLKGRMLGLIVFIIAISMISLIFTMIKMQTIGGLTQKLYDHPFTVTTNILEAEKIIAVMYRDMKDVVFVENDTQMDALINDVTQKQKRVLQHFSVIEERILGEEGKALHDMAKVNFISWEPIRKQVISLMKKGNKAEASALVKGKEFEHVQTLLNTMTAMTEYAYNKANQFKDRSAKTLEQVTNIAISLSVVLVISSLVIGFYFSKSLSEPILHAVQNLSSTSAQILAAIQEQSASVKEQAVAIQQTTATMEEVSRTGSQISQKAKEVAQSAEATSTAGTTGMQAVIVANQTMDSIREQVEQVAENIVSLSEKTQVIGAIISTVNDISEQSNLLSLNASIEAAGAGEHGQRFSVVANEIKNLADQAKDSTIEIRTILTEIQKEINMSVMSTEESVKRVDLGKTKSDIASKAINALTRTTEESVQAFQQIVAGTNQQQIGMEQVTEALKSIHKATSQTALGVAQIEQAVSNLNQLGGQLKNLV